MPWRYLLLFCGVLLLPIDALASKPKELANHLEHVQITRYQDFYLAPISIEFDAYWLKKIRSNSSSRDLDRMRSDYPALLRKQLVAMLTKHQGLPETAKPHQGTLVIRAKLSRFKLTAPDLSYAPKMDSYVDYTGAAEVDIRLFEFEGESPLLEFKEYHNTPEYGGLGDFKKTDRARNKHDFKLLCSRWAKKLEAMIAGEP